MKLKQLLSAIEYTAESVPELEICDIVYDSRKAVPGCLFVCLRGASADGHRYAAMAAEKGAAAILACTCSRLCHIFQKSTKITIMTS